jgi:hypothetical protein
VRNGRWAVKLPTAAVLTSCPRPTMTSTLARQLLLGTDERNPLFTVYHRDEGERASIIDGDAPELIDGGHDNRW